jgi:two-component system nitrate/nitrite sensor histidine kinase NarX
VTYQANIRRPLSARDVDTDGLPGKGRGSDVWLQGLPGAVSVLYAFAETINEALSLDTVLNLALKNTMEYTGMDAGGVLLFDPLANDLSLKANLGGSPELVRTSAGVPAREGLMPRMLTSVLVTNDLGEVSETRQLMLRRAGFQSLLSIPLIGSVYPQGVMVLASRRECTFLREEMELFAVMGRHVGLAINRVHLQSVELTAAIQEERRQMAWQLHDDIAQTLGYLGLRVDNVMAHQSLAQNAQVQAKLEEIRTDIERAYQRVRTSIVRLREDISQPFDLKAALQEIIVEFKESTQCRVEPELKVDRLVPLSPIVAIQVRHIIQEALTNTRKHAQAHTVHLVLQELDETIEIVVQDDGQGFDVETAHANGQGFGLRFMKERAERLGGSIKVTSASGEGTRIVVHLPLKGGTRT